MKAAISHDVLIRELQALEERQIGLDAESASVRTRIDELREELREFEKPPQRKPRIHV
ncbi:MAG TPA: hypothetical protein VLT33_21375 [Labilithrix sp.]|nr:hypothetical protein [Labilithrix sp.]